MRLVLAFAAAENAMNPYVFVVFSPRKQTPGKAREAESGPNATHVGPGRPETSKSQIFGLKNVVFRFKA